jgi:glutamyl-tRNA reductase
MSADDEARCEHSGVLQEKNDDREDSRCDHRRQQLDVSDSDEAREAACVLGHDQHDRTPPMAERQGLIAGAAWDRLALRAVTPQTASIRQRECVSVPTDALGPLLRLLGASTRADEWFVLSTCGRTEVYAVTHNSACAALDEDIAAAFRSVHESDLSCPGWTLRTSGVDAARHLFRVAAGVESVILGDVQLLGQLRFAYAKARALNCTGPLLNKLCETALHAGKRARAETGIATGASSMASAAVELAMAALGGLTGRHAAIVGGGQMGRAIAAALGHRYCEHVTVATRDPDFFAAAGGRHYASVVAQSEIATLLARADVLFAASGAMAQVITADAVARAMTNRKRPLLILDLAMPHQVDPNTASMPGVRLVSLEMLERTLQEATRSRSQAIAQVERILDETLSRMLAWSRREHEAA